MPINGRAKELSKDYGEPMSIWLPRLMRECGTPFKVAAKVGVYESTVRYWLKMIGHPTKSQKRSA